MERVYTKLIAAIAAIGVLAGTVKADDRDHDRDHGRLFDNDRHEQQFGGDHEGRGHDAHIPVVPETNPAPVLGAMLLVGGIAYEIHRRRANKVSVKE